MKEELDTLLYKKYPKIFKKRDPKNPTAPYFWLPGFPGDGWFNIIDDLCSKIQAICDREGFQCTAHQVKEKFGGLRFYCGPTNDEIDKLIREAEGLASQTCEICGKLGKIVNTKGWLMCACPEHEIRKEVK